jgi:enamine deaminase RidA (YjgF/YER057c/UK114 family)
MSIRRINPSSRMSQAVIHGGTVYLSGVVGEPTSDFAGQVDEALAAVDAGLAAAGSSRSKLLQVTIWLADISDFAALNAIYEKWIDPENLPARACAEAKLAAPQYQVEIIATAAL